MSALQFNALLTTKDFEAGMAKIKQEIRLASGVVNAEAKSMDSSFASLGTGIAAYFSGQALSSFAKEIINIRGEFQKTEVAFSTMLGDSGKARELMGQMVQLAAKTPFALKDVADGAKQLLAFQVPANEVVDTLTRMGNIAAGLSVPLERVNLVYGQIKALGKLTTQDMKQFMTMGIPLAAELAEKFKVTESAIFDMVTEGKVGFKDVQDVLFDMTNEGGMFFNLMESQSKTLSGQWSNLQDSIDQVFNSIGQQNEGLLSSGIEGLTYLVENYQDVVDILTVLIATYGAYRVAIALTARSQEAAVAPAILQSFKSLIDVLRGATSAQIAFNAAGNANPWIAITSIVIALGTAIYTYREELAELVGLTEEHTTAQKVQTEVMEKYHNEFGKGVASNKTKIQDLIYIIKSEYSSLDQRREAYNKLIAIDSTFRGTLDAQYKATARLGQAFDSLVVRMQKFAMVQAEMAVKAEKLKAQAEAEMNTGILEVKTNEASEKFKKLYARFKKGEFTPREFQKLADETGVQDFTLELKKSKEALEEIRKDTDYINKVEKQKLDNLQKTIAIQEAQVKGGKIQGRKLNQSEMERLKAELENNKKIRDIRLGVNTEVAIPEQTASENPPPNNKGKGNERQLAEFYSEKSLAGLKERVSLWNKALEEADGDNVEVLAKNKYGDIVKTGKTTTLAEAKKEVEKISEEINKRQKEIEVKGFEEQMSELKRQFSVRDRLMEQGYSKETVDGMFPELKDKTLIQSLEEQAVALDKLVKAGNGGEKSANNLIYLNEQIRVLLGQKTALEEFNEMLTNSKEGKTSSEYIDFLNSQKTTGGSELDLAKNAEIEKRIESEKQSIKDAYQQFLSAHLSYEQEKTSISKKYDELRKQAKTQAELDTINEAETKDLSALALQKFQNSDAWIQGFQDMANLSSKELDKVIEAFEKFQLEAGKNLSPTDLKTYMDALKQLKDEATNRNPFKALSEAVKEYIKDLKEGKDTTASMKAVFKSISASADLTNQAISSGLEIADSLGVKMSDSTKEVVGHVQTTITGIGDLAAGIASKDPAQIIKGIAGVVKGLAGLFNGDRKKERRIQEWAKEVEGLKEKYEELQNQVKKALGEDVYADQQKIVANLRQQQALLQKMMNEEKNKKKSDSNKVKDYKNQIYAIDQQIEEMYANITKSILQTDAKDLASQLADALIEAYSKGEDAASAYGKVADDVMKNAVKNALKLQLLEKPMQDIVKQMLKNMGFDEQGNGSFDGLTKEERDSLKAMMASASQNYMNALGAYEDLFGESAVNAQGLKGDIKGVTEKTAGALEGQINAIRIYQVEALNVSKKNQQIFDNQLRVQSQIEINTRPLIQIQKDIAELNSKVTKPLAGFP